MHPISNRDVDFFILEFLLIIGFILYPFTIYNSRALHFVRNFFDIFWQILNSVDCHNYQCDFLCKEHTATKLPQYISPAKPYFSSSDIAIIPYAAFAIYCIYRDTLLCLAYSLLLQYKNHRYTKRMDFSTLFFAYYFSAIFSTYLQQAFMLHCSDSAISIANSILIFELS